MTPARLEDIRNALKAPGTTEEEHELLAYVDALRDTLASHGFVLHEREWVPGPNSAEAEAAEAKLAKAQPLTAERRWTLAEIEAAWMFSPDDVCAHGMCSGCSTSLESLRGGLGQPAEGVTP